MSNRLQVILIDDLDGSEAAETIAFSLDGKRYEIDLSAANAARFREAFAPYMQAARPLKVRKKARSGTDVDARAVREWARAQGMTIAPRGRIPSSVLEQYRAAG